MNTENDVKDWIEENLLEQDKTTFEKLGAKE